MAATKINRLNFTQTDIAALKPAALGKRAYYNDTRIPGLQLQVTDKGVKTYYVYRRINNRPTRVKLGHFPDMKPAQARDQAQITLGQIAGGVNPKAIKTKEAAERITLIDAFEEYLKVRSLKAKTAYDYRRVIELAFPDWKTKHLARITKDMVGTRHQCLGKDHGEAYANLAMRVLNAIYNFAHGRYEDENGVSLLPPNPVRRLSNTRAWYRQKRRDSRIEPNELKPWFNAVLTLKNDVNNATAVTVADFLLLLIFTGLRRAEAAQLRWASVNLDNRTLTVNDTKNHENHTLPLPSYVHQLLTRRKDKADKEETPNPYVFPGKEPDAPLVEPRRYIEMVVKESGVTFTLHDLRRTFTTTAESLDISAYAVKRLVNHKMRGDITASYIVTDVERLRDPMQRVCDYLMKAGGLKKGAVVPLRSRELANV
jgi:integrase